MNILKSFIFIGTFLMLCQAQALVVAQINELEPLQVTLSQRSFNRIAIEGGVVKKIIAPEGILDVRIDDHIGQAFITFKESLDQPLTISVITEAGYIQDIELSASDKSTEVILLQERTSKTSFSKQTTKEEVPEILKSLSKGIYPSGYVERAIQPNDKKSLSNPHLVSLPICAAEGPFERIVLYLIENTGKSPLHLHPSQLSESQDQWVFLDQEELAPKAKALLMISKKKEAL